jgi:hypothetical protein
MLSEQVAINGTNPQENDWSAGYALIQHLGLYLRPSGAVRVTPGSIAQPS